MFSCVKRIDRSFRRTAEVGIPVVAAHSALGLVGDLGLDLLARELASTSIRHDFFRVHDLAWLTALCAPLAFDRLAAKARIACRMSCGTHVRIVQGGLSIAA